MSLAIKFDLKSGFTVENGEFIAEGFSKGFTLFLAIRKAFYYENEILDDGDLILDDFDIFIEKIYSQLYNLPSEIKNDFDFTYRQFKQKFYKRKLLCSWDVSPSMFTCWTECIELLVENNQFSLVYYRCDFDFEFENYGWDHGEDSNDNLITKNFLDFSYFAKILPSLIYDYHFRLETDDGIGSNEVSNLLSDFGVYDEKGNYVILIERNIKSISDIKLLDFLNSPESGILITDELHIKAMEGIKRFIL